MASRKSLRKSTMKIERSPVGTLKVVGMFAMRELQIYNY